jgi:hypothetical protein
MVSGETGTERGDQAPSGMDTPSSSDASTTATDLGHSEVSGAHQEHPDSPNDTGRGGDSSTDAAPTTADAELRTNKEIALDKAISEVPRSASGSSPQLSEEVALDSALAETPTLSHEESASPEAPTVSVADEEHTDHGQLASTRTTGDVVDSAGTRDLTVADVKALRDITGGGHQELNRTLSEGSVEDVERIADRVAAVSQALERLPVHDGTVLRGSGGNLTEAQIEAYEPGEIRVENRFVHTSVNPEVADGWFHGNVVWAIESKTGRDVEAHSEVPSEKEVMFDKFSRFEVLAKDRVEGTDQWLIYMKEL